MGGFPHFHWGHESDKPIVGSPTQHEKIDFFKTNLILLHLKYYFK